MIAEDCGIKKASIFSHFKSRDEIENEALKKCLESLGEKQFEINFRAKDVEELFVGLINSFIDVFTDFPQSALLSYCEQKKTTSEKAFRISEDIDRIISSRLLVTLDYCVQRSWTGWNNTDSLSLLLCPPVRNMLLGFLSEETLINLILHLLKERNAD